MLTLPLDMMFIPSRENVQCLLTLCLVDDLAIDARPASWLNVVRARLSAAIRHARDLGMDRAPTGPDARIWRCARILDIWHASKAGAYPLVPVTTLPQRAPGDDFHAQLTNLSFIHGRVLALIYGPDGLHNADSREILRTRDALAAWKEGLPHNLQASGVWSGFEAGVSAISQKHVEALTRQACFSFSTLPFAGCCTAP